MGTRRDLGRSFLPGLALATELHRYPPRALGFAPTKLSRGRNQVVAGLEAAAAVLRAVTEAPALRA
jgi:hypothetical protein